MTATITGVVERTFRCTAAPAHCPSDALLADADGLQGIGPVQVRVVIRQHLAAPHRVHALLQAGIGQAGLQAAELIRRRLKAGTPCTATGAWLQPLPDTADLLLKNCTAIHGGEAAAPAAGPVDHAENLTTV